MNQHLNSNALTPTHHVPGTVTQTRPVGNSISSISSVSIRSTYHGRRRRAAMTRLWLETIERVGALETTGRAPASPTTPTTPTTPTGIAARSGGPELGSRRPVRSASDLAARASWHRHRTWGGVGPGARGGTHEQGQLHAGRLRAGRGGLRLVDFERRTRSGWRPRRTEWRIGMRDPRGRPSRRSRRRWPCRSRPRY